MTFTNQTNSIPQEVEQTLVIVLLNALKTAFGQLT